MTNTVMLFVTNEIAVL